MNPLARITLGQFRSVEIQARLPLLQVDAATEAALSSYVASQEQAGCAFDDPYLAFAFCYLASHFGLGLVSEGCTEEVMAFLEENKAR